MSRRRRSLRRAGHDAPSRHPDHDPGAHPADPEINCQIGRFIVDFLWRRPRLIVEVDGYAFHSGHRVFESDHKPDLELGAAAFR